MKIASSQVYSKPSRVDSAYNDLNESIVLASQGEQAIRARVIEVLLYNVETTLASSFLIGSSSFSQVHVTRTTIKA